MYNENENEDENENDIQNEIEMNETSKLYFVSSFSLSCCMCVMRTSTKIKNKYFFLSSIQLIHAPKSKEVKKWGFILNVIELDYSVIII